MSSNVSIAFYRGRTRFFNRAVSWWTRGPFSHTELVIDGVCYTASYTDGGVRKKVIDLKEHACRWVVVPVPWADAEKAVAWFEAHMGQPYDVKGLLGFVFRAMEDDRGKFFCSESVGSALGFEEAWRLDPNTFFAVIKRLAPG